MKAENTTHEDELEIEQLKIVFANLATVLRKGGHQPIHITYAMQSAYMDFIQSHQHSNCEVESKSIVNKLCRHQRTHLKRLYNLN